MHHEPLRTAFDFTPSDPAPPIATAAVQTGIATGGELVSPALDLVRLAQELNRLEELKQRIEQAPADSSTASRSKATMLALIHHAREDDVSANLQLDELERLLLANDHTRFSEHWPETLVIQQGVQAPQIREAARDMVAYTQRARRYNRARGPEAWERWIDSLAGQLTLADSANSPLAEQTSSLVLRYWSPTSRATARSRGQGFPAARWQRSPGQVDHLAAHSDDYLRYHIPLRGEHITNLPRPPVETIEPSHE